MKKQTLEIGNVCWHPQFGACRIVSFDKRGLVQVKWPENSSSQAYWSLVEPGTLKNEQGSESK